MISQRAYVAAWFLTLALAGCREPVEPEHTKPARLTMEEVVEDGSAPVITLDHRVRHVSTVPANAGEEAQLFLREKVRNDITTHPRKAVLMIHGASVPVLPGADLNVDGDDSYDWALWLAQAGGLDVFMLDFQGSGLSTRPKMDDPCNAAQADQARALIPNPLTVICQPSYAFQLVNSQSDWDELDTVIEYIRALRGVEKVALVGWSQGSFRVGPYAVQHPDKVESLFLLSAIFNPNFRSGAGGTFDPPASLPLPGTPMTLRTRSDVMAGWNVEVKCVDQVEAGVQDAVWRAIMDNDPIGRTWGPPEGVMRVRTPFLWGWNAATAQRVTVPVLMIRGEFDTGQGGIQDYASLYAKIPHDHKMWFTVQCAGHFLLWERQRKVLQHISKQWLKNGEVEESTTGKFFVDTEGIIHPLQ